MVARATIEDARIALFQNDHAASLDSVIARVNRGGHEVRESNVGDESAALLHLEDGFLPGFPLDDAHLAVEHAGVYADIGNRLGQAESAAPRLAILARLRGSRKFHVTILLLRGSALVNRSQGQTSGEAGGGSASVHPSQLKGHKRQREVPGSRNESTLFGIHKDRRNARLVKSFQHLRLGGGPLVGIAATLRYQASNRTPGNGSNRLDQHLEVIAVGKAPLNLAGGIGGEGTEHFQLVAGGGGHRRGPFGGRLHQSVKPGTHRSVISVTGKCDVVEIGGFATSEIGAKTGQRRFIGHKRESSDGDVAKEPTVFARKETSPSATSHPPS